MSAALPRLDLSPPSRWRVFLALVLAARECRYPDSDVKREADVAELAVADLAQRTGLCPRTVKTAMADLRARGLVERVGRYRRLRIILPAVPAPAAIPMPGVCDARNPSSRSHAGAVSTGTLVPVASTPALATFTARQAALVGSVLSEASTLLGTDAWQLTMHHPGTIGFSPPVTYGEAYERLRGGADARQLSAYVRAVLGLVRSERVQGTDLT